MYMTQTFRKWPIAAILLILASTAVYEVRPVAAQGRGASRPQVVRPSGPVWQVIRKNCTACHGIDDYAFYALDRGGWQSLIDAKHKDGSAILSSSDQKLLLDWLETKFGPNTKPF